MVVELQKELRGETTELRENRCHAFKYTTKTEFIATLKG